MVQVEGAEEATVVAGVAAGVNGTGATMESPILTKVSTAMTTSSPSHTRGNRRLGRGVVGDAAR